MRHSVFTRPRSLAGGGELLSIELLEEHARRLAALFSIAPWRGGSGRAHLRQVKAHMRALRDVYTALVEDGRYESLSPAAEWLLDNFHIISAAARDPAAVSRDQWPAHVHHAFVTRLLQRSRALGAIASGLHRQLDEALAARGQTVEDAIRAEGQSQASEQAGMANLIGSLRLISTFDWSDFFESVSHVEQVLQRDPAGVYGRMDFRSRDRYRHAIEELAVPTGEGQLLVAL